METAPRAAVRRPELVTDHDVAPVPDTARSLIVLAVYELSEAGRKASLLAGGDGHALQQLKVQVPTSRLHLVTVDAQGHARLKLRPRFELNAEHQVVRIDTAPTYDAPPSLEDLFREAGRNHELERAYQAERNAARAKRREAERARRDEIAKAFMADKSQRALAHPAPSPNRCTLATEQGRILFDVRSDQGVARDIPAEAHRRFRADLAAKKEKNLRERAAQLALHEEKKRFIAEWIEKNGSQNQKERQCAGLLSMTEALEALADQALGVLSATPLYQRNGLALWLDRFGSLSTSQDRMATGKDLIIVSSDATVASPRQWDFLITMRNRLPDANIALRMHRISWRVAPDKAVVALSAVVTLRYGPFLLRREYAAPAD